MQPDASNPPTNRLARLAASLAGVARLARRDPAATAAFLLAAFAAVLPIWIGRYLPLLDYPNHLSNVFVWFHLDDPRWGFSPWYARHLVPLPYWGHYGAVYLLAFAFGVEAASKVYLTLVVLSLPAAMALWARRCGRDPRLAIIGFPLAWNYNMANGFINYCAGLSLLFVTLTVLDRWAERPSLRLRSLGWALAATLLGAALYFHHILIWAALLAVGGATALLGPRPWRLHRALAAALPLAPVAYIGVWAYGASREMGTTVTAWTASGRAGVEAIWYSIAELPLKLPGWLLDFAPDHRDEALAIAMGIVWIALAIAPRTRSQIENADANVPKDAIGWRSLLSPSAWRMEGALLMAIALLVLLPRTLFRPFYWYAINARMAILVALLAALLIRRPVGARGLRHGIWCVLAILCIAYPLEVARHVHRFGRETAGFDEVIEALPARASALPLMVTQGSPEVNVNAYNQWGSYVQLRRGGYTPFNNEINFPIVVKRRLPAPHRDGARRFKLDAFAPAWDWFLVYSVEPIDLFAGAHDRVELVRRSGPWSLWRERPVTP